MHFYILSKDRTVVGMPATDMATEIKRRAATRLGEEIATRIFGDSKPPTTPEKLSLWVKEAMDRMDVLVDDETRSSIMHECGANCANINSRVVEAAKRRRAKHKTNEEFIEAEMAKPQKGTRLERDGDALILTYTPREWSRPMRCYCSLMRGIPSDAMCSATYCQCGVGFVKMWWEAVLGKPVAVDLLESAISGSNDCRFHIAY
jgi:hypothetical protein